MKIPEVIEHNPLIMQQCRPGFASARMGLTQHDEAALSSVFMAGCRSGDRAVAYMQGFLNSGLRRGLTQIDGGCFHS